MVDAHRPEETPFKFVFLHLVGTIPFRPDVVERAPPAGPIRDQMVILRDLGPRWDAVLLQDRALLRQRELSLWIAGWSCRGTNSLRSRGVRLDLARSQGRIWATITSERTDWSDGHRRWAGRSRRWMGRTGGGRRRDSGTRDHHEQKDERQAPSHDVGS